ncbi:MAG: late competence development ComFB family protein [Candidatus Omnitrophica bacterium]|nr:late competence development ComFB family protein [Candidatus Omnitrophota bacterium]
MVRARNIMEAIVAKHLDDMLRPRRDICTCKRCRDDIYAYALSRIPARYVTSEAGAMHTHIEQVAVEQSSLILKELLNAIQVVSSNPRHEKQDDRQNAYKLLMKQIMLDRGVDFSQYRERMLQRRIAVRMRERKVETYPEYLQILTHEPQEYEALFDVLTINVSSFFRDDAVWEKLENEIVPEIIGRKAPAGSPVRIWSAGCSHGEEPYSLAIMLYELLETHPRGVRFEIVATDIDKACLRQAGKGHYRRDVLRNVNARRLKRFFLPVDDEFIVVPHIKTAVHFEERNLIHDAGISGVDMILCRNVFIYFNRSLQEQLIMKYYYCLAEGGYFIMGNSETLLGEARELFREVDAACRIYQKLKAA